MRDSDGHQALQPRLRVDDNSFDAVTNVYGLMFCPEPQRAVREVHRALKPGGLFALVTWDEPSKSLFFTVIGELAANSSRYRRLIPQHPASFDSPHRKRSSRC